MDWIATPVILAKLLLSCAGRWKVALSVCDRSQSPACGEFTTCGYSRPTQASNISAVPSTRQAVLSFVTADSISSSIACQEILLQELEHRDNNSCKCESTTGKLQDSPSTNLPALTWSPCQTSRYLPSLVDSLLIRKI